MRFFLFLGFLLAVVTLAAQHDTTVIRGVEVRAAYHNGVENSAAEVQALSQKELEQLPALQLSDVLKFLSGIVVRDYGGVGGMKSVSVRGFSGHHTALAYDGMAVTDCQTGQLDLGKFSLENVEKVTLTSGSFDDIFLPARLFASASVVSLETKKPQFLAHKPVNVQLEMTGGSFGLYNPLLIIENRWLKDRETGAPRLSSSILVNYVQSEGDFPFTLSYGGATDSTSQERRNNAHFQALTAEANLFANFSKTAKLHAKVYYYNAERGLPGAVIFYNTAAEQTLWDENIFAQIHFENHFNKKVSYQINGKYNHAYQRYLDPEYLNTAGKLDNSYWQQEYYLANVLRYKPVEKVAFSIANDVVYNNMNSNIRFFVDPSRFTTLNTLQGAYRSSRVKASAGVLHTYFHNRTAVGASADNGNKFSPSVNISCQILKNKQLYINAFYKNIFRLPTFNDLYYREVGTLDLLPENTHQVNLGLSYIYPFFQRKMKIQIEGAGYYNYVEDKIVAIPNKNLFTWSMVNYGRVRIAGADAKLAYSYQIDKKYAMEIVGNYSYQYAVDITDYESKTYLHQIPYTPLHSGSVYGLFTTPWCSVTYSMVVAGVRYTTTQNKESNSLPPYFDQSVALSHQYKIKKITLGYQVELLNIANAQYEVINNYPMPGRSLRVTVKVGW